MSAFVIDKTIAAFAVSLLAALITSLLHCDYKCNNDTKMLRDCIISFIMVFISFFMFAETPTYTVIYKNTDMGTCVLHTDDVLLLEDGAIHFINGNNECMTKKAGEFKLECNK